MMMGSPARQSLAVNAAAAPDVAPGVGLPRLGEPSAQDAMIKNSAMFDFQNEKIAL